MQYSVTFPGGTVQYRFQPLADTLTQFTPADCVLLTDSNIIALYPQVFDGYRTIVLPAGEENKTWDSISDIAQQLLEFEAHRKTTLIGIGGGVVTDVTGFIASVYMRGINFGFVPTTLLAMADAAIGGKNGVNLGLQKNLLGAINQPGFILYDASFLQTLPAVEWSNGFAEIIKYACLFDKPLFNELAARNIHYYQQDEASLSSVIERCVAWKNKVVLEDERETGMRKLLNLGHTAGHAFETLYHLPHGHAVAVGIVVACILSELEANLDADITLQIINLLERYHLPFTLSIDIDAVMNVLKMDKKRNTDSISYILLNDIGTASVKELSFNVIKQALTAFAHASHH